MSDKNIMTIINKFFDVLLYIFDRTEHKTVDTKNLVTLAEFWYIILFVVSLEITNIIQGGYFK